jgi:LCP family protein required for cell wall assembly
LKLLYSNLSLRFGKYTERVMKNVSSTYVPQTLNVPWKSEETNELPDKSPNQKRGFSFRRLIKRVILLFLVALIATGSYLGYVVYRNASKVAGTKNPFTVLSTLTPSTLQTTNGRINILLAGYSADDPGHQGADLTDSIMIISIDPTTKSADLISVPRDLYVNIPGFGYDKINAAYEDGESEDYNSTGYSDSGMALLGATISQDFGVQFNYDALLNYQAVEEAVNDVGGVTITINSPDPRGLYDPNTDVNLPNGKVTLTGLEALNLTRARGDGYGSYGFPDADFDRTEHQQQILDALKDKASSTSVITNPLKIADLVNAVGSNVKTNLTIGDLETLYKDSRSIANANITNVTLNDYSGQDLLTDYTTADGEDALIPAAGFDNYSQIQTAIQNLLSN